MDQTNIEVKVRCRDLAPIRAALQSRGAEFRGTDHQIDTYFVSAYGRLKLRQGNIENRLVHYDRANVAGPRSSRVTLYSPSQPEVLRVLLTRALDVSVIVEKQREIYYIGNIKFHLDVVTGLGKFVEIEAFAGGFDISTDDLHNQVHEYLALFDVQADDYVELSYSDLLAGDQR